MSHPTQSSLFDVDEPRGTGAYGQPATAAKPSRSITNADQVDPETEKAKRKTQKAALLAALRKGPLTNNEIIKFAQHVSGRVYDLRQDGHDIETERVKTGVYRYILHEPARVNASEAV